MKIVFGSLTVLTVAALLHICYYTLGLVVEKDFLLLTKMFQ